MLRKSLVSTPEEFSAAIRYENIRAQHFASLGPHYIERQQDAEARANYYFLKLQETA